MGRKERWWPANWGGLQQSLVTLFAGLHSLPQRKHGELIFSVEAACACFRTRRRRQLETTGPSQSHHLLALFDRDQKSSGLIPMRIPLGFA